MVPPEPAPARKAHAAGEADQTRRWPMAPCAAVMKLAIASVVEAPSDAVGTVNSPSRRIGDGKFTNYDHGEHLPDAG